MTAKRFGSFSRPASVLPFLALLAVALQGCLFSSGGKGGRGAAYRGYYSFGNPTAFSNLSLDSTYQVLWSASDAAGSGAVVLSLYKGDAFLGNLATALPAGGPYSWSLSLSRSLGNYRFGSGSDYRLRLASASDTSKWDFSPVFSVHSRYTGTLALTAPAKGSQVGTDSSSSVSWSASGEVGTYVGLQLYKDTVLARSLTSSVSAATGSYTWIPSISSLGSGDDYHIRIFAVADPSIGQTGPAFRITSSVSGSFAFRSPRAEDTVKAGYSAKAAWTTTGSPGSTAQLSLWRDSAQYASLTTVYPGSSDSAIWYVPATAASGRYRLRLASTADPGIYAFSPYFYVSGVEPDAYEPDNTRGAAKAITADGVAQRRNIASGDTDWVRFDGTAGKTYLVTVGAAASASAGAPYVYAYVTDSLGTTLASQSGSRISLSYAPARDGKYFLRIQGYSGTGPYDLSLLAYDPGKGGLPVKFTAPDSNTVWSAGSAYPITWIPDSATFGSLVYLDLYNDTVLAQGATSYVSNSGTYSWTIQAGTYTSGKYRIRLSSYDNRTLYGFSPYFTISGVAPDEYEPDNLRSAAKAIEPNGAAQQHNIVYGDTDWVRFDGVAGKTYMAAVNAGGSSVYLSVTDSTGYSLVSQSGSRASATYTPSRAGKYYVRVQYYSGYGAYSLSLAAYDAGQGGVPVKFASPDSNTVWSAGSAYAAAWVPDSALFGAYVTLGLYQGDQLVYALSSYSPNSGSASVTLPYGLASGKDYRLRLTNYSNYQIYGSSRPFSIAGTAPDSLEPNDSAATAKPVTANAPRQSLSLTYKDKDWFRFTAKAQKLYLIQAYSAASLTTLLRLWPANGSAYLLSGTKASLDTVNGLAWVAPSEGDYLVSAEGSSASYYGPYGLEVKEIDPAGYKFGVSAPAAAASAKAGTVLAIQWSDPSGVKGYVDIFLYNADGVVQTIAANVSNTGSYSWTVPTGLPARSDYFVKVISRLSSSISGTGEAFSIAP